MQHDKLLKALPLEKQLLVRRFQLVLDKAKPEDIKDISIKLLIAVFSMNKLVHELADSVNGMSDKEDKSNA